jgi:hypothetical protein
VICEAVWAVFGDGAELGDHYEDCWVENGETRLYYLLVDEGPTIACYLQDHERQVTIRVAVLAELIAELNQAYVEKHGGKICAYCAEMVHKDCIECPDCGCYVDGTACPELELPETLADCIEDGGSDKYLWRLKERLPTHQTPSNHSYVFIELSVHEPEGKHRDKFTKPDDWYASVVVVNVGMAGKDAERQIRSAYEMSEDTWKALNHETKAHLIHSEGIHATVWQEQGKSPRKLLDAAVAELPMLYMMGGAKLDSAQNAIGSTGWDFMKGDILAGLKKQNPTMRDVVEAAVKRQS